MTTTRSHANQSTLAMIVSKTTIPMQKRISCLQKKDTTAFAYSSQTLPVTLKMGTTDPTAPEKEDCEQRQDYKNDKNDMWDD